MNPGLDKTRLQRKYALHLALREPGWAASAHTLEQVGMAFMWQTSSSDRDSAPHGKSVKKLMRTGMNGLRAA